MKTKEFEQRILFADFSYVNDQHQISIYTKRWVISRSSQYLFSTNRT